MAETILRSKEVAATMKEGIAKRVEACKAKGVEPTLALLLVGEKPDSVAYEQTAVRVAGKLGIVAREYLLPEDVSQDKLAATIREINEDATVHGCLMFRPLPKHIDEDAVCNLLAIEKDIDGISAGSMAATYANTQGFAPCTAESCVRMLEAYDIPVAGKRVAVIGRSLVIGKPVSLMLLNRNATVTICHSRTQNLAEITSKADIVVCATGRARAYGKEFFSEGQIVLDVGTNVTEEGSLCGDVDFDAVEPIVAAITPVPGGIGGLTTTLTMDHVVTAAERTLS